MKASCNIALLSDPKSRPYLCCFIITVSLICGAYLVGTACITKDYGVFSRLKMELGDMGANKQTNKCKNECRPLGSEALPAGIVEKTSNLQMRSLWEPVAENVCEINKSMSLLAMAVGIKQKHVVDQIVNKFSAKDFVVMLFHYDGVVDVWNDLDWSRRVIHISAMNQTKWWFAKRFLHPDIVAQYDYIFLWDEDLGVKNFNATRYLTIVKDEGLEISQPALDPALSELHHQITVRRRRERVHRRYYKFKGGGRCDGNSTAPPCLGWVEMMAPVFSRAAWRCAWYMIQNDLIHAWGLDMQLGYCAQGDRAKNVGVVDSEYVVHLGLPTLGKEENKLNSEAPGYTSREKQSSKSGTAASSVLHTFDNRSAIRRQSYIEMGIFQSRWKKAIEKDECWVDPYQQLQATNIISMNGL